ncbi:MAG: hypothetical protein DRR42_05275, partial [Gammaproteobacteria bacterium]
MLVDGEINLLVVYENIDDANRLINLLRNASYTVHSTVVETPGDLVKLLKQQRWDLALVEYESQTVKARDFMSQIKKLQLDIPTIIITSDSDPTATVEGMRIGADYVLKMDEDQYFLLAVTASLANFKQRSKQEYWKKRYLESESRYESLIDGSSHAIAIVQDGTFVYMNEEYARLFGYEEPDDMVLLPVIDTIAESSQAGLKPYLKPLSLEESVASAAIDIDGIKPDNGQVHATLNIAQVLYQGHPALQFLVPKEQLSPPHAERRQNMGPEALSFIQPKRVLDGLSKAILKAGRTEQQSLALYIRVDQFNEFRQSSGPASAEQLFAILLDHMVETTPTAGMVARYNEDTFVMLLDIDTLDEGREYAENLCRNIATKTFSAGNESVALSLTIAVAILNDAVESPLECINQCEQALAEGPQGLGQIGSEPRVYCCESRPDYKIKSEQQIIEFAQSLLANRGIGIAFQPIAALKGDIAEYYEVLMRPKTEEYPDDVPSDIIERVFKTKVAIDIDRWVILEAVKALTDKLVRHPQTKLFINLSAATIQDAGFSAWLKVALQATNISPTQ